MKKIGSVIISVLIVSFVPIFANASEITIRPFLIDETMTARDIEQKIITVSSEYEIRKAILYATVNEITIDNDGEIREFISPVMTDRTTNVTSWIEISRGRIELPAGETREVPLTIRTHPQAEPGEYHVFLGIVEAANRPEAQKKAMAGDANGVIIKITIDDQREDSIKINSFTVDRFVTGDDKKVINIELENLGDLASAPKGEIIFYDSRGIEVSSVNIESAMINPGEIRMVNAQIPLEDDLGRYKANLNLKYGEGQTASLHDTTFFYLMPMHLLLAVFGVVLVISLMMVLLFRRALVGESDDDYYDDVPMYVKDGHEANPQDHDIDLKNNQ